MNDQELRTLTMCWRYYRAQGITHFAADFTGKTRIEGAAYTAADTVAVANTGRPGALVSLARRGHLDYVGTCRGKRGGTHPVYKLNINHPER